MKNPMTRQGFNRIADEHRQLLQEERPKVVRGITIAAAEGDRSENAEYIYGKKRLREIDKRLRYLTSLMKDVTIFDPENIRSDTVCFASTVVLIDEDGKKSEWTIVGVGEADATLGTISWRSPLATAVLNRRVGDLVMVHRPAGEIEVEILDIKFHGRSWTEFYT